MKKPLLVIWAMFIYVLSCSAQERVNKSMYHISDNINSILTTANGWRMMSDGQWKEKSNMIISDNKYHSEGEDFKYYQFRDITFENKVFTILIKHGSEWRYRYPNIQEDWSEYPYLYYVVFDNDKIKNLLTQIKASQINKLTITPLFIGKVTRFQSEQACLREIESDITSGKNTTYGRIVEFVFEIAPYTDKNITQFVFYDLSWDEYLPPHKNKADQKKSKGRFFCYDPTLGINENAYFETSWETFNSFIKLPE